MAAGKKTQTQRIEAAAREAFSRMRTLYDPADVIDVSVSPRRNNVFCVYYRSGRYGATNYYIAIDPNRRKVIDEGLHVGPEHRANGYGRELVCAKHEILRRLGFSTWGVPQVLDDKARAFWLHMGYEEDERGNLWTNLD